jgi:hypothetical protein
VRAAGGRALLEAGGSRVRAELPPLAAAAAGHREPVRGWVAAPTLVELRVDPALTPFHPPRLMYRFVKGTDEDRTGLFKMIVSGQRGHAGGGGARGSGGGARARPFQTAASPPGPAPPSPRRRLPPARLFRPQPHIAQGSWVIRSAVGTTPVIVSRKLATTFHVTGALPPLLPPTRGLARPPAAACTRACASLQWRPRRRRRRCRSSLDMAGSRERARPARPGTPPLTGRLSARPLPPSPSFQRSTWRCAWT